MHEVSIAQGIVQVIQEESAKHGNPRITKVGIVYGRLTTVVPESLEMAFEAVSLGTCIEGAVLALEEAPLVVRCHQCSHEFSPQDIYTRICPQCSAVGEHTVVSGKELYVSYIETE